jgi:hypothetical protein
MKANPVLALLPAMLLAACTSDQFVDVGSSRCQTIEIPVCSNDPKDPVVRIQYRPGRKDFLFLPPSVCVDAGETIEFKLDALPEKMPGSVAILPKNGDDTWLVGTNSADEDSIEVFVPEWVDGGVHDYNFIASNGSCVDPRVDVRRH